MKNDKHFAIQIEGMTCSGCVRRVTAALKGIEGVVVDVVEVGKATGHFDADDVVAADLVTAIDAIGFKAKEADV